MRSLTPSLDNNSDPRTHLEPIGVLGWRPDASLKKYRWFRDALDRIIESVRRDGEGAPVVQSYSSFARLCTHGVKLNCCVEPVITPDSFVWNRCSKSNFLLKQVDLDSLLGVFTFRLIGRQAPTKMNDQQFVCRLRHKTNNTSEHASAVSNVQNRKRHPFSL